MFNHTHLYAPNLDIYVDIYVISVLTPEEGEREYIFPGASSQKLEYEDIAAIRTVSDTIVC